MALQSTTGKAVIHRKFIYNRFIPITFIAILLLTTSCHRTHNHDVSANSDDSTTSLPVAESIPPEDKAHLDNDSAQISVANVLPQNGDKIPLEPNPKHIWLAEADVVAQKIASHDNLFEDYSSVKQAKTDKSGMISFIIKQDAIRKPVANADFFKLHYSLWNAEGQLLSSTYYSKEGKKLPPKVLSWDDPIPESLKQYLKTAHAPAHIHVWVPPALSKYELPFYVNGKPIERGLLMYDLYLLDTFSVKMPPTEVPSDAVRLEDGLAWRIVSQGNSNTSIEEADLIQFDYTTWNPLNGKRIFSTLNHREAVFSPSGVPKDWRTILPKLHVGDIAQIWVPKNYIMEGDDPKIQEIAIRKMVVKAPKELANPQNALLSPSGIPYMIIESGIENTQPTANSVVSYHDSEWFCQQELCKSVISTYQREMKTQPLAQASPTHRDMLITMHKGEKRLVWFSNDPNRPGVNTSGILSPHLLELVDFN